MSMTMTMTDDRPDTAATATARSWAERAADLAARLAPEAAAHDRAGTFVHQAFDLLRAEGFLAAPVPVELGGGGASFVEVAQILTELAKGDPAAAVTLSMHYHLVSTQLWRHRRGLPGEAVLRRVAAEDLVLVSTGASDWLDSSGVAVRVEGGFRVSGRKAPASGAPIGDVAVTSIAWPDAADGPQVIHASIPFATAGVRVERTWDTMGLRGTGSDTIVFDDVLVSDAMVSLIRPAGEWRAHRHRRHDHRHDAPLRHRRPARHRGRQRADLGRAALPVVRGRGHPHRRTGRAAQPAPQLRDAPLTPSVGATGAPRPARRAVASGHRPSRATGRPRHAGRLPSA
jgi:alkylation response protein AidB-like acyl-CoA dehydrogenase